MKAMSAKRQMVPEEIKPSPSKPTPSPSRKRKSTDDEETVGALATPPPATKEAKTESDGEEKNQKIRENLKRNSVRRPATPLPPVSKGVRNATPVPPKQCVLLSLIIFRSKLTVLVLPHNTRAKLPPMRASLAGPVNSGAGMTFPFLLSCAVLVCNVSS